MSHRAIDRSSLTQLVIQKSPFSVASLIFFHFAINIIFCTVHFVEFSVFIILKAVEACWRLQSTTVAVLFWQSGMAGSRKRQTGASSSERNQSASTDSDDARRGEIISQVMAEVDERLSKEGVKPPYVLYSALLTPLKRALEVSQNINRRLSPA